MLNRRYLPCFVEFSQPLSVTPLGPPRDFSVQTRAVRRAPTRFCRARDSFLILVIFGPHCVAYLLLGFCPEREHPRLCCFCVRVRILHGPLYSHIFYFLAHIRAPFSGRVLYPIHWSPAAGTRPDLYPAQRRGPHRGGM